MVLFISRLTHFAVVLLVYISVLFHYWHCIAVFSLVLLSWCWESCRNNQGANKYSRPDGEHLLETDISFLKNVTKTILTLNWQMDFFFWPNVSFSDGRLSVLNNWNHLLPGHMGLLCFSLGFSDLSVIGAVTDYSKKKNCVVPVILTSNSFSDLAKKGNVLPNQMQIRKQRFGSALAHALGWLNPEWR